MRVALAVVILGGMLYLEAVWGYVAQRGQELYAEIDALNRVVAQLTAVHQGEGTP